MTQINSLFFEEKSKNKLNIKKAYDDKEVVLKSAPSRIQLEHTTVCNLQCIACPHFYQKSRLGYHLDFTVVEKLKEILPSVSSIQLNGGGEPFLAARIEDALEIYASYGVKVSTTTNLTHINSRIVEMIGASFDALNVSCDGATAEIFEGIRKKSNFSEFISNIEKVRAVNQEMKMTMGVTAFRQNLSQLPDLIILAKNLGFQAIVIGRMIPRASSMPHTTQDDIMNVPSEANYWFEKSRETANEIGLSAIIPPNFKVESEPHNSVKSYEISFPSDSYQDELAVKWKESIDKDLKNRVKMPRNVRSVDASPSENNIKVEGNCDWLYETIFINANGDVGSCCQKPLYSLGNILKVESFFDIWNGSDFVGLRKAFWDNYIPKHCEGCQFIYQNSLSKLKIIS